MNRLTKSCLAYTCAAVGAVVFDRVYALFAHGVESPYMRLLFAAPLLLGALPFLLFRWLSPGLAHAPGYRLFGNAYATGVALLMNGMLLRGILDIAGGTSNRVIWFFIAALVFLAIGTVQLVRLLLRTASAA